MNSRYSAQAPDRSEVDGFEGITVLDFGTDWCGFCRAAEPAISRAMEQHPQVRHLKIEDGKGRPLGRSFRVKLWPTLVFLDEGREVDRLVRPSDTASIVRAIDAITA